MSKEPLQNDSMAIIEDIPKIGDVIRCEAFRNGLGTWCQRHQIEVDVEVTPSVKTVKVSSEASEYHEAIDESRASACYVVRAAGKVRDTLSDCEILCQRLHDDGTFDPNGEMVQFRRVEKEVIEEGRLEKKESMRLTYLLRTTPIYLVRRMKRVITISYV